MPVSCRDCQKLRETYLARQAVLEAEIAYLNEEVDRLRLDKKLAHQAHRDHVNYLEGQLMESREECERRREELNRYAAP